MDICITPAAAKGKLTAPPSKSLSHRLLIAGGLAEGESVIENLAFSEDVLATIDCLTALGATCRCEENSVRITGLGGRISSSAAPLSCRECGSTLRFFIPIALLSEEIVTFTGSERLFARPLTPYEAIAKERGLLYEKAERNLRVRGRLTPGRYRLPGDVSSQFISGLLFALPLLEEDSRIELTGSVESRSYIGLTQEALAAFGVNSSWENEKTLLVPGRQRYSPRRLAVEGDYSNAAFFAALNYLGGRVTIDGLSEKSRQGDRVYTAYFKELAAGCPTLSVTDCPDLAPVLMALAAALQGCTLTGTDRLKIKESDRGAAMAAELKKLGIETRCGENTITVLPGTLQAPKEALSGHNDHRIVMALSLLLSKVGGVISGAEAVAKSLPDFFDRLRGLGIPCSTLPQSPKEALL